MSEFIPLAEISAGTPPTLDVDGPRTTTSLRQRQAPLASSAEQLRLLQSVDLNQAPDFAQSVSNAGWGELKPASPDVFQINVGKLCNTTCRHCHVDAGPDRVDENMDRETVEHCLRAIDVTDPDTIDLTGGAPELNPHFKYLVDECVRRGKHVIDRCNLTILTTRRYAELPQWLAERNVEVVCSLPHYRRTSTDAQRGDGAFQKSIKALRRLNEVGYGKGDSTRRLTLVANPVGAFLAGSQESLEAEWKQGLKRTHGVSFDRLIALNNMPISRYLEWLVERGLLVEYMMRLVNAFNPAAIDGLMCRNTLSVSWNGYLYDCDFNQQLDMRLDLPGGRRPHISEFDLDAWMQHSIRTARHCFGCTAGAGSSCGGQTT